MSVILTLEDARARLSGLPTDDAVLQDMLDEQEAWLARRLASPLTGERTETFYVGLDVVLGTLGLKRYTDAVVVEDGNVVVDPEHLRLIDNGSGITRSYYSATPYWTGPYVTVTYTPNDQAEVRRVLFGLVEVEADSLVAQAGNITSETLGDYSYVRGAAFKAPSVAQRRAALADSLKPKHDQPVTLRSVNRAVADYDPVINRPEREPYAPMEVQ